jgi:hypothetical protein
MYTFIYNIANCIAEVSGWRYTWLRQFLLARPLGCVIDEDAGKIMLHAPNGIQNTSCCLFIHLVLQNSIQSLPCSILPADKYLCLSSIYFTHQIRNDVKTCQIITFLNTHRHLYFCRSQVAIFTTTS